MLQSSMFLCLRFLNLFFDLNNEILNLPSASVKFFPFSFGKSRSIVTSVCKEREGEIERKKNVRPILYLYDGIV